MSCKNQFKSFSQIKLLCKSQVLSFHAPEVAYISMQSSSALLSGYPGNHCVKEILFPLLLQTNSDSVISSLPPIHTEHSQGFNWHVSTWKVNKKWHFCSIPEYVFHYTSTYSVSFFCLSSAMQVCDGDIIMKLIVCLYHFTSNNTLSCLRLFYKCCHQYIL